MTPMVKSMKAQSILLVCVAALSAAGCTATVRGEAGSRTTADGRRYRDPSNAHPPGGHADAPRVPPPVTPPATPTKPVVTPPPVIKTDVKPPVNPRPTPTLPVPETDTDGTKPPKVEELPDDTMPMKTFTVAEATGQPAKLVGAAKRETAFWVWYDAKSKSWKVRTSAKDGAWTIFRGRVGVAKGAGNVKAVSVAGQETKDQFKSSPKAVHFAFRTGPKMDGLNVKMDPLVTCVAFGLYTSGKASEVVYLGEKGILTESNRFQVCAPAVAEMPGPTAKQAEAAAKQAEAAAKKAEAAKVREEALAAKKADIAAKKAAAEAKKKEAAEARAAALAAKKADLAAKKAAKEAELAAKKEAAAKKKAEAAQQ